MVREPTSGETGVLGDVEVDGVTYGIHHVDGSQLDVVRRSDGRMVGRLRGSSASMWLLEAEAVDEELLRAIVRTAIEEGLLVELPTD